MDIQILLDISKKMNEQRRPFIYGIALSKITLDQILDSSSYIIKLDHLYKYEHGLKIIIDNYLPFYHIIELSSISDYYDYKPIRVKF